MASFNQQGGASASPAFNPAIWLADWSVNGGIAFVASGRLYLGRLLETGYVAAERLDSLNREITRSRGGEVVAAYLTARQIGQPATVCGAQRGGMA